VLGGVKLRAALAAHGLIDEYTLVVHPVVAGRGPRLLDGIRDQTPPELVEQWAFRSGAMMQRYRPTA
jgi:dihydrofolate reductase